MLLPDALEIDPRRDRHGAGRQAELLVAQIDQGGKGEPAAGGIARDRQPARGKALLQQPAPRLGRVFHRRRERVFRRQSIVDHQHARARGGGDVVGEPAMRVDRADGVAAAMQVKHRPLGVAARRRHPFRRHAAGIDLLALGIRRAAQDDRHLLEPGAHLGDVRGFGGRARAQQGDEAVELGGGHRVCSLGAGARRESAGNGAANSIQDAAPSGEASETRNRPLQAASLDPILEAGGTGAGKRRANLRLHRRRRRIGRRGRREPAVGGCAQQACCCWRPAPPAIPGRASRSATRELITNPAANWLYSLGARGQHQRPQASGAARPAARRLQRDQRHGVRARPGAGLRHLGADGQPGLELRGRAALLQAHGKLRAAATIAFAAATGRCASPTPSRATRSSRR